jgi:imidazoleglycerol phosphate synthase glutamine amidotransferase subunit HisH
MVTIVDYGVGNLASIANMVRRAGAECVISGDPAVLSGADRLILPGVGASIGRWPTSSSAGSCRRSTTWR